jgi:hypothetical protein
MSETKHTPGPWQVEDSSDWMDIVDADGDLIAEIEPGECEKGNAQLIAAAPELLEALKAVLLFHSGSHWDDAKQAEWQRLGALLLGEPKFRDYHYARGSMTPTSFEATTSVLCDMIRTAIAKATGATTP